VLVTTVCRGAFSWSLVPRLLALSFQGLQAYYLGPQYHKVHLTSYHSVERWLQLLKFVSAPQLCPRHFHLAV
jgi:hypothetical protein